MVVIHIPYNCEIIEDILCYLNKYANEFELDDIINSKNDNEIKLLAYFDKYNFKFNNITYDIYYEEENELISTNHGPERKRNLSISSNQFNNKEKDLNSIKNLLIEIQNKAKPILEDKIRIYIANSNRWEKLNTIIKRNFDTIFLNDNKIINDIDNFMSDQNIYEKKGIKYKRNYLLHGPPGTGKTTLINGIASKYNLDIYMTNFNSGMNDSTFMKLVSKLSDKSILLLEDIDCLFDDRESKTNISFSTILNVLDGFASKNRLITFMTTNYFNKLESALKRPGRIDYIHEFKYATKKQAKDMYNSYFNNNGFENFYKKINNMKISTAVLQKFFFENRNEKELLSKIDLLNNLSDQYNNYQNIYL
tara:strand:+ start:214 stop:1305 length:1092 start_codon:yes stop_codon:yes gene_type:complete